jgi:hypothetical protein
VVLRLTKYHQKLVRSFGTSNDIFGGVAANVGLHRASKCAVKEWFKHRKCCVAESSENVSLRILKDIEKLAKNGIGQRYYPVYVSLCQEDLNGNSEVYTCYLNS